MIDEKPPATEHEHAPTVIKVEAVGRQLPEPIGQAKSQTQVEKSQQNQPTGSVQGYRMKRDKPPRPEEYLLIELWYGSLRAILKDAIVTAFILGSLQGLHLYVRILSLKDWLVNAITDIHDWSTLIVLALVSLGFILRMLGYTLQESGFALTGRDVPDKKQKG